MIDEMHKNGIRVILDGVRRYIRDFLLKISIIYIYIGIQSF